MDAITNAGRGRKQINAMTIVRGQGKGRTQSQEVWRGTGKNQVVHVFFLTWSAYTYSYRFIGRIGTWHRILKQ